MTPKAVGWIFGGAAAAIGVAGVALAARGRRGGLRGFGAMNRIGAAVALFDHRTPQVSDLRELIERVTVSEALGENPTLGVALESLVSAYNLALAEEAMEKDKPEPEFVSGEKAEDIWRTHATRGFREFFPQTSEGDESIPWWPDWLGFDHQYTKGLVADMAYLTGYVDGRSAKAMSEYAREQMLKEGR